MDRKFGASKSHKKAFILLVHVTFETEADMHKFIELWTPLAEHVAKHEPDTLGYELSISDKEANRILVYERYTEKIKLADPHQQSKPFKDFQKAVKEQVKIKSKDGHSYIEADIGFC